MKHKGINIVQAKILRKNMTKQERKMWGILRNNNFYDLKFRRQVPIGDYIVDFLCESKKLIIELDGGQHNEPQNICYDIVRADFLHSKGYNIIRFWNNDVDNNIEGVCLKIKEILGIYD